MTRGPSTVIYASSAFTMLAALSACGQTKSEKALSITGLAQGLRSNTDKKQKH